MYDLSFRLEFSQLSQNLKTKDLCLEVEDFFIEAKPTFEEFLPMVKFDSSLVEASLREFGDRKVLLMCSVDRQMLPTEKDQRQITAQSARYFRLRLVLCRANQYC